MPKNRAEAIRLYKTVGKVEFRAQLELGRIYSRGQGVPIDPQEDLRWHSVAAARNENNCVFDSGTAALAGPGTQDEIQEAKNYLANAKQS